MTKFNAKSLILDKFSLSTSDFLGSGMEAKFMLMTIIK